MAWPVAPVARIAHAQREAVAVGLLLVLAHVSHSFQWSACGPCESGKSSRPSSSPRGWAYAGGPVVGRFATGCGTCYFPPNICLSLPCAPLRWRVWAQDSRVISPSTAHPKTPIPGTTTFTVCDRCCREYADRRGSLCFSVCASRAGLTPSPTCPSLGKVASAKAEMWPLRQPNGDATRQPSSVRTDGGFLHVSENHSSAAR
jgi:hypothetical protein